MTPARARSGGRLVLPAAETPGPLLAWLLRVAQGAQLQGAQQVLLGEAAHEHAVLRDGQLGQPALAHLLEGLPRGGVRGEHGHLLGELAHGHAGELVHGHLAHGFEHQQAHHAAPLHHGQGALGLGGEQAGGGGWGGGALASPETVLRLIPSRTGTSPSLDCMSTSRDSAAAPMKTKKAMKSSTKLPDRSAYSPKSSAKPWPTQPDTRVARTRPSFPVSSARRMRPPSMGKAGRRLKTPRKMLSEPR